MSTATPATSSGIIRPPLPVTLPKPPPPPPGVAVGRERSQSNSSQGEKRKRKKRSGKRNRQRNKRKFKPYSKMTWKEKKALEKHDEMREYRREQKRDQNRIPKDRDGRILRGVAARDYRPQAPKNTTQFIVENNSGDDLSFADFEGEMLDHMGTMRDRDPSSGEDETVKVSKSVDHGTAAGTGTPRGSSDGNLQDLLFRLGEQRQTIIEKDRSIMDLRARLVLSQSDSQLQELLSRLGEQRKQMLAKDAEISALKMVLMTYNR